MGFFHRFPYTNFHELNLDWLLQQWTDFKAYVTEKLKNAGINYVLPAATRDSLGGIKVGNQLEVTEDGTLNNAYVLPSATSNSLGGIKVGNNLAIRADGTLDAAIPEQFLGNFEDYETFYVNNTSGSDSNNGTVNSPWKTLTHALEQTAGMFAVNIALTSVSETVPSRVMNNNVHIYRYGGDNFVRFSNLTNYGYLKIGEFSSYSSGDAGVLNGEISNYGTLDIDGRSIFNTGQNQVRLINHSVLKLQNFLIDRTNIGIYPGSKNYLYNCAFTKYHSGSSWPPQPEKAYIFDTPAASVLGYDAMFPRPYIELNGCRASSPSEQVTIEATKLNCICVYNLSEDSGISLSELPILNANFVNPQ